VVRRSFGERRVESGTGSDARPDRARFVVGLQQRLHDLQRRLDRERQPRRQLLQGAGGSLGRLRVSGTTDLSMDIDRTKTRLTFDTFTPEIGGHAAGMMTTLFKNGRTLTAKFDNTILDGNVVAD
jgi:hypothetical protein